MRAQWTDFVVKYCPRTIKMDCQNNEEATRDWYGQDIKHWFAHRET